jgi:hypothetical protein
LYDLGLQNWEVAVELNLNGNSSGGRKRAKEKTSKNLHVRPGSLLKNLAVYMFEGCKGQTSFVTQGKAAAIGTAATGT